MAEPLKRPDYIRNVFHSSRAPRVNPSQMKPLYQGFRLLQFGYIAAPLIAGVDKFLNGLTDWTQYVAPVFPQMLGITPQAFMYGVGVIEIIAGIGMIIKPQVFSFAVSAWFLGIICNLLIAGSYYDIALRDFGLAIGAASLGLISIYFDRMSQRNKL